MNILEGNKINCRKIYDKIVERIKADNEWIFTAEDKFICILEGNDFASQKYVELKQKTAEDCGIKIDVCDFNKYRIMARDMNLRGNIYGILQLPAPANIVEHMKGECNWNFKDVDYLLKVSRVNLIDYSEEERNPRYSGTPATVRAVLEILNNLCPDLSGKKVAVVGCRSKTVGAFLPSELLKRNATISMYHSKSKIKPKEFEDCDVVISCVGKGGMIKQEHFGDKRGCICIDIGVSRGEDNKVIGDFDKDIRDYQYYTPYVNGVGLLTRIFLIYNYMSARINRISSPFERSNSGEFYINDKIFDEDILLSILRDRVRRCYDYEGIYEYVDSIKDQEKRELIRTKVDEFIEEWENEPEDEDDDDDIW